jgi:hypothetical protein
MIFFYEVVTLGTMAQVAQTIFVAAFLFLRKISTLRIILDTFLSQYH